MAEMFAAAREPRLPVGARLVVAFVCWFVLSVLAQGLAPLGLGGEAAAGVAQIVTIGLLILVLWRWMDRRPWRALGLPLDRRAGLLGAGFLLGGLAMTAVIGVAVAGGEVRIEAARTTGVAGAAGLLTAGLLFYLGVGWSEELLFRGYMLQNLGERLRLWSALLLTSMVFALGHALHAHTPLALVEIALGGLLLGLLRLTTGVLWAAIGFHTAWDYVQSGVLTTPLLPANGLAATSIESTPAGLLVPVLIAVAALVASLRPSRRVQWQGRLHADGRLPSND